MKKTLLVLLLFSPFQAHADSYGSLCVMRGLNQQCTFWQWNSKNQSLFVHKVVR